MHKGVILLTKAEDRDDAISNVRSFMENYREGDVWDWFVIGGRWSNTLAPAEPLKKFIEQAHKILDYKEGDFGVSYQKMKECATELQKAWDNLGLQGHNSYYDHYNLPDDGDHYDVLPLSECLGTVKEWVRDLKEVADREFEELTKARQEAKEAQEKGEKVWDSSAYHAGIYRDAIYNNFCFDSNVYDIERGEGESIPDDITGYYAVMVDMHN